MANEPLPVVYTPEFKRSLRQLAKKYRHIREDAEIRSIIAWHETSSAA